MTVDTLNKHSRVGLGVLVEHVIQERCCQQKCLPPVTSNFSRGGCKKRKRRSHSSPPRQRLALWDIKSSIRSSNPTSSEHVRLPNAYPESKPEPNFFLDPQEHTIFSQKLWTGYYLSRPPSEPMQVILVGKVPEHMQTNSSVQRLLKNMKKIEENLTSEVKNQTSFYCLPLLVMSTITMMADSSSIPPMPATALSGIGFDQKLSSHNGLIIRELLEELLAYVHLSAISVNNDGLCAYTTTSISMLSEPSTDLLPDDPDDSPVVMDEEILSHNIATQTASIRFDEGSKTSDCSDCDASQPEEWVGGVRALRDSHVRLVLRQLRHIDRLNRALDRAAVASNPCSPRPNSTSKSRACSAATNTKIPCATQI